MIKEDNLFLGKYAKERLMAGIKKAAQVVGSTMGTAGSNSLIECIENPQHFSTNDGATILGSIKFADTLEEMGRQVLFEAVGRANKQSGDGSSTTCVLTAAILEEGMKHLGEASPMEIKRSLEMCIPLIEESVNSNKKKIDVSEVKQVATISAEDEKIGETIQEIYKQIGKDGIINWDISKTAEDSYVLGKGITIDWATYVSPYMCDFGTKEIRLADAPILLTRRKITSALEFEGIAPALFNQGIKDLIVFADDIDLPAITDLVNTRRIQGFRIAIIKMPILWKDEWFEDLALATGATVIDSASGIQLKDIQPEHLGKVGHILVTKEDTYIDGMKDMTSHIANLMTEGTDEAKQRATRLNTRTARYYVGAHSESALAYRRLKVEDAINAASCALENGVVAGGGIALTIASKQLGAPTIGGRILKEALKAPFRTIVRNCGENPEEIEKKAEEHIYLDFYGYDTKERKIKSMFNAGIVDPTDVVLNAVKNAIGVAGTILTCNSVITLPKEEQPPMPQFPLRR